MLSSDYQVTPGIRMLSVQPWIQGECLMGRGNQLRLWQIGGCGAVGTDMLLNLDVASYTVELIRPYCCKSGPALLRHLRHSLSGMHPNKVLEGNFHYK